MMSSENSNEDNNFEGVMKCQNVRVMRHRDIQVLYGKRFVRRFVRRKEEIVKRRNNR